MISKETDRYFENMSKTSGTHSYTEGQIIAYHAWKYNKDRAAGVLEVSSIPYEKDIPDFVKTLREAGIKEFIITDSSSGLMSGLHGFADNGCHIESICRITRGKICNCEIENTEIKGISMTL